MIGYAIDIFSHSDAMIIGVTIEIKVWLSQYKLQSYVKFCSFAKQLYKLLM